jgi:GNAT superfamily N-acetyltransferase
MNGLRRLTASDISQALLLKQAAGWNQTREDWLRLLRFEPEGCFGIERDGRLVATTTAICYGRELAWIGMVLTAPEFRGQGMAGSLMRATLDYLEARNIQWIKLDATDMGRNLYQKFGFADECPVERWVRPPGPAPWRGVAGGFEFDAGLDRQAFGADRSRLLADLATGESGAIAGLGYAMGRPGANATYFGPCVAANSNTARTLLEWFLARHSNEPVCWDVLPANQEAIRLAQQFGFERSRQLSRMAKQGAASDGATGDACYVFAIGGFELG